MNTNKTLVNEIVDNASKIPLEWQERVLDIVKAMAFTREVTKKESQDVGNKRMV